MLTGKWCAWASALVLMAVAAATRGAEFQVNSYTEHDQTHPAVAIGRTGDFVVAWRSHPADGRGGGVYARCYHEDGTPVGLEFKVNESRVDLDSWRPAVAIAPSGAFVIAWVASRDNDCDIAARMFDSQGQALTEEFQVNDAEPRAAQSMPSIAMDPWGNFVIVWTNWTGAYYSGSSQVVGRMYYSDGTPCGEQFMIGKASNADLPEVAMDDAGRFVVAWIRMGDTYNRPYGEYIMFRQFEADGTPAGDAVQVTGDLNSRWYGPSVARIGSGAFVIAWAIGPFPYDIVAQDFDSDGQKTTEPYLVNTCLEGNQGHPRVAASDGGDYLFVWDSESQDGDYTGVFGQCCTRAGGFDGPECCMNACVQGRQWYPDVAVGPAGKYVVVWISEGQDGSGYGIFAKLGTM
jgi:hypothetical protein